MADPLLFAQTTYKPRLVVDLATVGYGVCAGLGESAAGMFTNSNFIAKQFEKAGGLTGDRLWRLPLWRYFKQLVTPNLTFDISNRGIGPASSCIAAAVLHELVPCADWAHIDIRNVGMLTRHNPLPYLLKDRMTGRPTRTIVQFLYQMACTEVEYVKVEDLAAVWCEWAEMELRQQQFEGALKLMQRATAMPKRKIAYHDDTETVQARLHRSLKVWSMYADLEESFGTFKTCKAVYERIIDLKICTPQIIINYGMFLEEHNYFEEAYRAYEKGISLFKWPNVYDIWNSYLSKFLERYGGTKLERARDLFEQCLDQCTLEHAKYFYLLYAKLEEEHGLARHAMSVYDRATSAVKEEEMFDMYNIFVKKAAEIYGLPRTREIYEKAIESLPEQNMRHMCVKFAELETKLGEVDRARAIYAHCSQVRYEIL